MASTTEPVAGVQLIPLKQIRHDQNVRQELAADEVDALAQSIELLGQLTPASVRPDGNGYVLIAGHKRYAALEQLGRGEIRAEIRDGSADESERAAENIVRSPLNAYEEALAVRAMRDRGLSEDGAAKALGWPKQRLTARIKLLELPEQAQQLTGQGVIPLAAVDSLRSIGQVSPELLGVLVDHVAGEDGRWVARELANDPGRALSEALRCTRSKTFAAYLNTVSHHDIEQLRLGKKTEQLLAEAEQLHRQIDQYAYGPPTIRFAETDIDQTRAAGVLIELERTTPIIVDRSLYRELCKQAIKRTVEDLRARAADVAQERKAAKASGRPIDPEAEARREHGRKLRALAEQAHGANLDLGRGLMNGLAVVDARSDMNVARFFVFGLLGADYDNSPYTQTGDRVAELAARGIRLVIEEFREDITKTRKDGSKGALRISYGDPRAPEKPIQWLWKFLDAARSPSDLYGRGLIVICAEQYASRLVVPSSQQHPPIRWSSHKDHAHKALAKLASPHLPATLRQLEKAIAKTHAEHQKATTRASADSTPSHAEPRARHDSIETDEDLADEQLADEDLDYDEDPGL